MPFWPDEADMLGGKRSDYVTNSMDKGIFSLLGWCMQWDLANGGVLQSLSLTPCPRGVLRPHIRAAAGFQRSFQLFNDDYSTAGQLCIATRNVGDHAELRPLSTSTSQALRGCVRICRVTEATHEPETLSTRLA